MKREMKYTCRKLSMLFFAVFLSLGILSSMREIPAAEKVHSIYWKASLRRSGGSGANRIKSSTEVVVVQRSYNSRKKSVIRWKGKDYGIPNSFLYFKYDLASKGDYSRSTKESFINHRKEAASKTAWLVWVSLDKQRVNVFQGAKGQWKLVITLPCSTGKASTPTPSGWHTVDFKKMWVDGCKYYTEVCGSGIHRWPGRLDKKILGSHTASHGCIRLNEGGAKWIYQHIPKNTRVLVY